MASSSYLDWALQLVHLFLLLSLHDVLQVLLLRHGYPNCLIIPTGLDDVLILKIVQISLQIKLELANVILVDFQTEVRILWSIVSQVSFIVNKRFGS